MAIDPVLLGNNARAASVSSRINKEYQQPTNNFGSLTAKKAVNTNPYNPNVRIIPTTEDMQIAQELWNYKTTNPVENQETKSGSIFNKFAKGDGELHPYNENTICIA